MPQLELFQMKVLGNKENKYFKFNMFINTYIEHDYCMLLDLNDT